MQRQDFVLIASIIKDINQRKATGYRIADIFAIELAKTNKLFDKVKFLKACGVEIEKK